jgi:hypothetical protein
MGEGEHGILGVSGENTCWNYFLFIRLKDPISLEILDVDSYLMFCFIICLESGDCNLISTN